MGTEIGTHDLAHGTTELFASDRNRRQLTSDRPRNAPRTRPIAHGVQQRAERGQPWVLGPY